MWDPCQVAPAALTLPRPPCRRNANSFMLTMRLHYRRGMLMFYAFYVIAIIILVLHFTGWLKRNNLEWLVLVLAVATFPAVIFLK